MPTEVVRKKIRNLRSVVVKIVPQIPAENLLSITPWMSGSLNTRLHGVISVSTSVSSAAGCSVGNRIGPE